MGEISISRRLDRSGEGEYRLNGAKCRLVDVLEVLSDTGLGKEMHSVVSQGRVESIVTSKPKDRRLLIEEAAGLGKHRKRRRRAQLKLDRTQENLDRALDVEREARSRLRPLKRQAEAAELHERLERQTLEARWELARDDVRARRADARRRAGGGDRGPRPPAPRRTPSSRRSPPAASAPSRRWPSAPSAARRSRAAPSAPAPPRTASRCGWSAPPRRSRPSPSAWRTARAGSTCCEAQAEADAPDDGGQRADRGPRGRARRASTPSAREELERELAGLEAERAAAARAGRRARRAGRRRGRGARARPTRAPRSRAARCAPRERSAEERRREAARVGAELAAVNQFLRSHAGGAER